MDFSNPGDYQKLNLAKGSTKIQLEKSMKNHIIAETKLEGRYSP